MLLKHSSVVVTLSVEVYNVMALWSTYLLYIYNQTVCVCGSS